jgi:hypothetical protein
MPHSPHDLITFVDQSPARVAAHQKEAWLRLFADDAVVEDPVGTPPARKADGTLSKFWDTFIAPNAVRFEILGDRVQGGDVLRDAVIHTRMRGGVSVSVPAYLLYEMGDSGGERRIRRLAAHWRGRGSAAGAPGDGIRAGVGAARLLARMVRTMGPRWAWGYVASFRRGAGGAGVRSVEELARAFRAGDAAAVRARFVDARAEVRFGDVRTTPDELLTVLAPGSSLSIEAPLSAGWTTACRFRIEGPRPSDGLALFEIARGDGRLRGARFFTAAPARASEGVARPERKVAP